MKQRNPAQIIFSLLLLSGMILGIVQPVSVNAQEAEPKASGITVDPQVLEQINSNGAASYWVDFASPVDSPADLKAAGSMDWSKRGWYVYEQLSKDSAQSQAKVAAYLKAAGVKYKSFWIKNTILVTSADLTALNGMLSFPEVKAIRARKEYQIYEPQKSAVVQDNGVNAIESNLTHINVDDAWALGYTGAGMVVANIDTGVRYSHDALVNQYRGNQGGGSFNHDYNWFDPYDEYAIPTDLNGHGTHTMGTMVGDDGGANQIGIAPGADWIACRGCNTSSCTDVALLTCAEFITAPTDLSGNNPNPDLRPDAVNNSWGDCDDTYDGWYQTVVNAWQAVGIYPIFSNGNASNCEYDAPPGLGTVGNPARYGNVTGVGASGTADGQYASFSNWGPSDVPDTINAAPGFEYMKPQVLAPGTSIRSSTNGSDSSYQPMSGTSMAAPHVTGLVALMWQAGPCLVGNYAVTETLMENTAVPVIYDDTSPDTPTNHPNYAAGWGEIDALAAVQAAAGYCGDSTLDGTVTDAATGLPIAGATITITGLDPANNRTVFTNASGYYNAAAYADTFAITAARFGYSPLTENGVVLTAGATVTTDFALTGLPLSLVSGIVYDGGVEGGGAHGYPLYASLTFATTGFSQTIYTDPFTGAYEIELYLGQEYNVTGNAVPSGYTPFTGTYTPDAAPDSQDYTLYVNPDSCLAPGYEIPPALTVYHENFDASNGSYTPSGTPGIEWEWGSPSTDFPGGCSDGGNCWDTDLDGNYDNSTNQTLLSPAIDLSGVSLLPGDQLMLEWMQAIHIESSTWDHTYAEISADGTSWAVLWQHSIGTITSPWSQMSADISAYAGDPSIFLRFRLTSDSSVTFEGYTIDEIEIQIDPADITDACTTIAGGVVAGYVYDGNTLDSLNGATVTSDTGFAANTFTNPDDPIDGFYWLFQPVGSESLTGQGNSWTPAAVSGGESNAAITTHSSRTGPAGSISAPVPMADVLWNQPLSSIDQNPYADQEFPDFPIFTSFMADDFINAETWEISSIFVPGEMYISGTSLLNASALTFMIYEDDGGKPAGDPAGGGSAPVWALSLPPTDPQIILSVGAPGGYLSNTTLNLAAPIQLPAGHYWLVFYPTMAYGPYGQYGRQPADSTNGFTGQFINPGGGFGYGTSWQAWTVVNPGMPADIAFRLEGSVVIREEEHAFTASMPDYADSSETVMVVADTIVQQDFSLGASLLVFDPESFERTMTIGNAPADESLTITNTGGAAADISIFEINMGYDLSSIRPNPNGKSVSDRSTVELSNSGPSSSKITGQPMTSFPNADVDLILDDGTSENNIGIGGTWEFIFVNRFTPAPGSYPFTLNEIQVYFDSSGMVSVGDEMVLVVYENPTGSVDPAVGSNFLASFPVTVQAVNSWNSYTLPAGVFLTGPGDVIIGVIALEVPGTVYMPAALDQTATQQRSWAGWWLASPPPAAPTLPPDDSWTMIDAYFPGNWLIRGLGTTGGEDVVWLSENPASGIIGGSSALSVTVTFDPSTLEQPGDYHAELFVENDSPYSYANIPVTLHLLPPDNWGSFNGTVSGMERCDVNPTALGGATVNFYDSDGALAGTTTTSSSGYYNRSLEEGTYDIEIIAGGYASQTTNNLPIGGGETVTVDFDLRVNQPCLSVNPTSLEQSLLQDTTASQTLTFINKGAGEANFELFETGAAPSRLLDSAYTGKVPSYQYLPEKDNPGADRSKSAPGPSQATTSPNLPEIILVNEGFEGAVFPPTGWMQVIQNAAKTWAQSANYHSGTNGAYVPWDYNQNEWLLTPELALAAGTLSLWSQGNIYWCRDTYDNCDLNLWLVVDEVGGGDDIFVANLDEGWPSSWVWTQATIDLAPFLPGVPVRIGFQYIGSDDADVVIDDIVLDGVEGLDVPWLAETPVTGTIPADSSLDVTVTFNSTGLALGDYFASLRVSNSPNPVINVPVTMHVVDNLPPVANDQAVITAEDTPVDITLGASDVNGDDLSWTIVDQPDRGALSGTAPNLTYTPDDDVYGVDSFTFKVNDGEFDSNVSTVSITVTPVNDAPVAVGDAFTMNEDAVLTVGAPTGVLTNDSDPEGDSLTVVLVEDVLNGTLALAADGSFVYTPDADFSGSDSFTYQAFDGEASSNVVTVMITVNDLEDARLVFLPIIMRR